MKVYEKPKVYIGNIKLSKNVALSDLDMQQVQRFEEYFTSKKISAGLDESIQVSYAK